MAVRLSAVLVTILFIVWATSCMERLFYVPTRGPTPLPNDLTGAESVGFNSADGTKLHGWFIPAANARAGALPFATVLHVHGNAGNIESHIGFSEHLVEAGFNLFIFDYRGYGQSEGAPRRRADLIADTHAALDTLLKRPDVDPQRIGLYGHSLGGAIGLNVMAERKEIRVAVIESAFTGWREMAAAALGGYPPGPVARGLARLLISNHDRPLDAATRIERPLLILHGTADSIIPFAFGEQLAAAGPKAMLHALPGGDHNTLRSTHPEIESLAAEFFNRHLDSHAKASPEN